MSRRREIVRKVKKLTRESGMASLITGRGANGRHTDNSNRLRRGVHTTNRKKLAQHIRHMKGYYKQQQVGRPMQRWPY